MNLRWQECELQRQECCKIKKNAPFGAFSYKNFELELSQFRKFQDQIFLAFMLKFYFCLDVLRICSV